MMFSATFACSRCKLRFARSAQCPSCGGDQVFSLGTRDGRARYRDATRTRFGLWQGILLRLAPWAPQRPVVPIAIGVGLMIPAAIGLALGPDTFLNLWFMSDLTTRYEGLSDRGLVMIAAAVVGAGLLVFTGLAKLGIPLAAAVQAASVVRMRVFAPEESARGETTLTGIARMASVEIPSGLAEEPCLLFGIRGEVGQADVADADGGDFDLELPSGERVMISLDHAMLVVDKPQQAATIDEELGADLATLLENRGIADAEGRAVLEEHLVRDGDEVTVTGNVLGGTVVSLGYRGATGARILAGDAERPLVVRRRERE